MIRLLGVDVGTVRVGIALSDPLGFTAQPLEVIERKKTDPFARIAALIAEHEVTRVIVGYPLTLAGEVGPSAQSVDQFITELEKKLGGVPIERWDERLTTAAAQRSMIEGGARRSERRAGIDKVAAALLLQSYLDCKPHA